MTIHISRHNSKLGRIPNLSLPPITTCPVSIPCANATCCYALKAWRQYPNVRIAWQENLDAYSAGSKQYFEDIYTLLSRMRPTHFRWHVAGDIIDQPYLDGMTLLAEAMPRTKFLVYTKRYDLDYGSIPPNLSVLISSWPGYGIVRIGSLPVAWCQDGTETRIPNDAIECPAGRHKRTCDHCHLCWELGRRKRDVWFHKH